MITDRFPSLKGLILDMDGVLWTDVEPIVNFPYVFGRIQQLGLGVVLATNNATKQVGEYLEKISKFGVLLAPQQIITSAEVAVDYLRENIAPQATVYVVGTDSLKRVVASAGYSIADVSDSESADAVIVGLDPEISYQKISNASTLIRNGALFVATNPDVTYPSLQGLMPGAGAMVSAIQTASQTEPIMIGKPLPAIFRTALKRLGLQPSEVLGVGDRIGTDVLGAQRAMCLSGLVLSGISTREMGETWRPSIDIIAEDLTRLLDD
jgi:4-nitrophenyl phosphatase